MGILILILILILKWEVYETPDAYREAIEEAEAVLKAVKIGQRESIASSREGVEEETLALERGLSILTVEEEEEEILNLES